jgi:hypothetical protein
MTLPKFLSAAFGAALLFLAGGCGAQGPAPADDRASLPKLGLMGSIPIYWGESATFGGLVSGEGEGHWARSQLETEYDLRLLDVLDPDGLEGLTFLMLAQPRPLAPAENVALDDWVRRGGHLLLFADPLLTGESRFSIGDRRRPQDTILLSPILSHWGLELQFDDSQVDGPLLVQAGTATIPVNLAGRFAVHSADSVCTMMAAGVLARCAIGAGRVVALADAAILDLHHPHPAAADALRWLAEGAFSRGK